ncbi:WxL domain-containing protein [Apilactobacillus ozensis]|uniref:WxL domain-containing protein n=1 Tax=Apilactobacillus ozensis TaxID=866801 RepID=UPI00200AADF9|nr:WxL domain-containing protein [Apilactobacillus ozensis]MCK8607137.1 WxL domain-containing protein [Apilactobacillus ozensis]
MIKSKTLITAFASLLFVATPFTNVFADKTSDYEDAPQPVHPMDSVYAINSDGKNVSNSSNSTSANSDANVIITKGYLTLDAVPDLSFGIVGQGGSGNNTTLKLAGNNSMIDDNGNQDGLLRVTDSRDAKSSDLDGYKVTAKLGNFNKIGSNNSSSQNNWTLNLNQPSDVSNANNNNVVSFINASLVSDGNSSQTVMKTTAANTGTTSAYYKNANNASLNLSNNVDPGKYAAPITWTLTPGTATANDSNSK